MNTRELLSDLIYPALYERIETALPEFRFKKVGYSGAGGYRSSNGLKIDGSNGDAVGRVRIYSNNISHLIDHRGGFISIWDYIQQRDGLSNQQTLLALANLAEVRLPERDLSPEQMERIAAYRQQAQIMEDANTFFLSCLSERGNPVAESTTADEARNYLVKAKNEGGRGYSTTDFRKPGQDYDREKRYLEVGFMPDPITVYQHLQSKGHTDTDIRSALQLTEKVHKDHRPGVNGYHLTLPYRDAGGAIRGFIIRNIKYTQADKEAKKYLFTKSLEGIKGKLLYNLKPLTGSKDLLIVESQFDADLLTVREIENVVAIGGKSLTADQVQQALRMKPKSITILLDNEAETIPQIKAAIDAIHSVDSTLPVYVASINQEGIKDPEEYVLAFGAEQFKEQVLSRKFIYWRYLLDATIREHEHKTAGGFTSDEQLTEFIRDVVRVGNKISLPLHKDLFFQQFTRSATIAGFDISAETLKATADQIRYNQDKEAQDQELKKLVSTLQDMQRKGETGKAVELMQEKARALKFKDKAAAYDALLSVDMSEGAIREREQERPAAVKTGYTIAIEGETEDINLQAGELTFIAGPTNHGKTAVLLNIALNILGAEPDRNVHLFTYEQTADTVLGYALNSYIDEPFAHNPRNSTKHYLRTGSMNKIFQDYHSSFLRKKERFFTEYVNPGRLKIHYVNFSADELIGFIEYIRKSDPSAVIMIDYVQKLRSDRKGSTTNRVTELKFICEDLNDCAINTGLPIVLGAQFNREVLAPIDMHPTRMAEGSDIEKIASEIIGIWNCTKPIGRKLDKAEATRVLTEYNISIDQFNPEPAFIMEVLKSRSLPSGHFTKLAYNPKSQRLTNTAAYSFIPEGKQVRASF